MGNEISGEESSRADLYERISRVDERISRVVGSKKKETGWKLNLDRDYQVKSSTKICPLCPDGGLNPLEAFVTYPCCCMLSSQYCSRCLWEHRAWCGECITEIPQGNERADLWLLRRKEADLGKVLCDNEKLHHLLGRIYVLGSGVYLDELERMPIYGRIQPPGMIMSLLNPPAVQLGVHYLTMAAEDGYIPAMLDLADAYCTTWNNDPFQKDKEKAEYWFQMAVGRENTIFPLALTRYGDFLKWESRFNEARKMYEAAASLGHARGQYEYAICLLEGFDSNQDAKGKLEPQDLMAKSTNDDSTNAIEWLCKASKNGFYIPSYFLLAELLIQISEREYGTAKVTGRSPLPRALQILALIDTGVHGNSDKVKKDSKELFERYQLQSICANCGIAGSDDNPLMACGVCGVVFYCSRVCIRKDFREGHKYDCCSEKSLFDFHSVKLSLPWNSGKGERGVSNTPSLRDPKARTLMQMVEDDTDEVYGEQQLDYDEHILVQLMQRMRINLETYLDRKMKVMTSVGMADELFDTRNKEETRTHSAGKNIQDLNLNKRIEAFSRYPGVNEDFVCAMHKIRELGNFAAHQSPDAPKLSHKDCKNAVHRYRHYKERFEEDSSKKVESSGVYLKANVCDQSKKDSRLESNPTTQQPQKSKKKHQGKKKKGRGTGKV